MSPYEISARVSSWNYVTFPFLAAKLGPSLTRGHRPCFCHEKMPKKQFYPTESYSSNYNSSTGPSPVCNANPGLGQDRRLWLDISEISDGKLVTVSNSPKTAKILIMFSRQHCANAGFITTISTWWLISSLILFKKHWLWKVGQVRPVFSNITIPLIWA